MPTRPFQIARYSDFQGLNDGLAVQAGDGQGSVVQNWLKKRRSLVRRPGYALVGEATLSIDPADLPGMGFTVILNLRGDQAQGANGAACSSWLDTSGNARHAAQGTGANQPVNRDAASPNGLRRMVEFTADNDQMNGTLPATPPGIAIPDGLTIFAYVEEDTTTTPGFDAQVVFGCGNSVSGFQLYSCTSAALGVGFADDQYGVNSGNARANHGATATGFQLLTLVFTPPAGASATWTLYRDQVQLGSAGTNWQATNVHTSYEIGNTPALNEGFDGKIGQILVVGQALDNTTRMGVEDFILDYFEG